MAEQKQISLSTDVRTTPSALLYSSYFGQFYQNQISVPVQISSSRFLLDFKTSLTMITDEAQIMSDEMLKTTMAIIVATYDRLNVDDTVDELIALGINVSESALENGDKEPKTERSVIGNFVQKIQERITSLSVESGLSNHLIQDVLSIPGHDLNLSILGEVSFAKVGSVVDWAQQFYAAFVSQEKGDTLTQMLASRSAQNPILKGAKALYTLFRSGTGAYTQVRQNYVLDELFTEMTGDPLVTTETLMTNKMFRIKGNCLPDIAFVDAIAGFMWSTNVILGMDSAMEAGGTVAVSSMVEQIVTGIGQNVPFVPQEAGTIDVSALEEHYKTIFLLHLTHRFLSDQPGDFNNRVVNSIKTNRFFKAEGVEKLFSEELYVLSACFEAFRDTAFYFRDLYRNEKVMFSDWKQLNPLKRTQLTTFMEDYILNSTTNSSFDHGLEHPGFYKQVAHLAAHSSSFLSQDMLNVEAYIPDSTWNSFQHYIMATGMRDETFLRLGTSGLLSGSWWDIPTSELPYGHRMLNRLDKIDPQYMFKVRLGDSLLLSPIVQQMYTIYAKNSPEFNRLRENYPDTYEIIRKMAQERRFTKVTELSMAMRLPLEIAEHIWDQAPADGEAREFLDLSGLDGLTFIFDEGAVEYFEFRQLSTTRYVAPFVGRYPLLVEEIDTAFAVEPLPTITSGFNIDVVPAPEGAPSLNIATKDIPSATDDKPKNDTSPSVDDIASEGLDPAE